MPDLLPPLSDEDRAKFADYEPKHGSLTDAELGELESSLQEKAKAAVAELREARFEIAFRLFNPAEYRKRAKAAEARKSEEDDRRERAEKISKEVEAMDRSALLKKRAEFGRRYGKICDELAEDFASRLPEEIRESDDWSVDAGDNGIELSFDGDCGKKISVTWCHGWRDYGYQALELDGYDLFGFRTMRDAGRDPAEGELLERDSEAYYQASKLIGSGQCEFLSHLMKDSCEAADAKFNEVISDWNAFTGSVSLKLEPELRAAHDGMKEVAFRLVGETPDGWEVDCAPEDLSLYREESPDDPDWSFCARFRPVVGSDGKLRCEVFRGYSGEETLIGYTKLSDAPAEWFPKGKAGKEKREAKKYAETVGSDPEKIARFAEEYFPRSREYEETLEFRGEFDSLVSAWKDSEIKSGKEAAE